jgi:hypothetical protein
MMNEEAWFSTSVYVPTVYESACKSCQRVLWPRIVLLFRAKLYIPTGRYNC